MYDKHSSLELHVFPQSSTFHTFTPLPSGSQLTKWPRSKQQQRLESNQIEHIPHSFPLGPNFHHTHTRFTPSNPTAPFAQRRKDYSPPTTTHTCEHSIAAAACENSIHLPECDYPPLCLRSSPSPRQHVSIALKRHPM